MRHYEQVTRTQVTNQLTKVTCDRCKKEIEPVRGYTTREFTLEYKEGDVYEGGYTGCLTGWEVEDLCNECIKLLHKVLIENGFQVKIIDDVW